MKRMKSTIKNRLLVRKIGRKDEKSEETYRRNAIYSFGDDSNDSDDFNFNIPAPPNYKNHTETLLHETMFEKMAVQVTVYSVSGIIIHTEFRQHKPRYRKNGLEFNKLKWSKSSSSGTVASLPRSKTVLGSASGSSYESDLVPTTAVVSVQREIRNGFAIETFLPSLKIKATVGENSSTQRCQAFWCEDNSRVFLGEQDGLVESSAIELTRNMIREQYRPGMAVGQQSSFIHERIDLNLFVGRGKEMIRLGIASLAITGDEENEIISNIPVKSISPRWIGDKYKEIGDKYILKHQKKKSNTMSFENEPHHTFSIDDNATLRVGIRVIPTKVKEQAERYDLAPKRVVALDPIEEDANPDDLFIELNDENSLVKSLIMKTSSLQFTVCNEEGTKKEVQNDDAPIVRQNQDVPNNKVRGNQVKKFDTFEPGLFCGAEGMGFCTSAYAQGLEPKEIDRGMITRERLEQINVQNGDNPLLAITPRTWQTKSRKRNSRMKLTNARVISMSNMSDISESTFDSDDESRYSEVIKYQAAL